MVSEAVKRAAPVEWFGQPRGLTVLFLTQMWEQFSFFGMRALLVYYMTKQLLIGQQTASLIYGLYTAFVYFTPIIGGVVCDRWLGRRRSVLIGGSIMAAGHFMMASQGLFYPALAVIATGNGLFLPSLPSQIASLYSDDDPRRGIAYNVYYVGINLGALVAPLICGTIGEVYGWHWGFTAAGLGMVCGMTIYVMGARYLPLDSVGSATTKPGGGKQLYRESRNRFALLVAIALIVVVFRGAYEQVGNTIALWADQGVDRTLAGGWTIPMTWFQALNPLLVFTLTPFLVAHWRALGKRNREPATLAKMALGAAGVSAAYLLIALVSMHCAANGAHASWLWLAAYFLLLTAGELYILPVGLGLFGRMAPTGFAATTIAAWFLAAFAGNLLAGALGAVWSRMSHAEFFGLMALVAAVAAALLTLLIRPIQRLEQSATVASSTGDH